MEHNILYREITLIPLILCEFCNILCVFFFFLKLENVHLQFGYVTPLVHNCLKFVQANLMHETVNNNLMYCNLNENITIYIFKKTV